MMDTLHLYGIQCIEVLQQYFQDWAPHMLFASHLGDPRNAFLIYFPLAYFLSRPLGVTVMWLAAVSEWLNAVLKWLLFGHRPYWWVNITPLYAENQTPQLTQYHLTCETGPGSPSGHAMCTSTVVFVMVAALARRYPNARTLCWVAFTVFMTMVCVSRLFIATHFPHQVVAGTIVGSFLGYVGQKSNLQKLSLAWYCFAAVLFLCSSPAILYLVNLAGWDASWSVALAKTWCARPEWVYLDTTPLHAVTRDASQLLGLGISNYFSPDHLSNPVLKSIAIVSSIFFTRGMEYVKPPQDDPTLYYILTFIKNFCLPVVIVLVIPKILSVFRGSSDEKRD